jgi:hypothetical protein
VLQSQVDEARSREAAHRIETRAREDATSKSNAAQQKQFLEYAVGMSNNQKDLMLGMMTAMSGGRMQPPQQQSSAAVTHQRPHAPALKSDTDGQLLIGNNPADKG